MSTSTEDGRERRRRIKRLAVGIALTGMVISSCGSNPVVTEARTAAPSELAGANAIGAAGALGSTNAPGASAPDAAISDDQPAAFRLELPDEVVQAALQQAERGAEQQAERRPTEPGSSHRLERVIDDKPAGEEPSFDWDQEAALACAHVEFALDALIAEDRPGLNRALRDAAAWARDSGSTEISDFVRDLRGTPDFAEAEVLVFDILGRCAEAGYEL